MHVTHDPDMDVAYIHLKEFLLGFRVSVHQHVVEEPDMPGMIVLDFDKNGRLIGIEVLGATKALPAELLRSAKRP
jgi:uncharacterized protein YuzE